MKKGVAIKTSLALFALMQFAVPVKSDSDNAEETPIIYIELAPTPTPEKAKKYSFTPYHYDWDQKTIDDVASIYWGETGYGSVAAKQKLALTQLVWNRMVYYQTYGDRFAGTISDVIRQRGEFNRGKVSDKNRKLAVEYLDMVRSQAEGHYCGITIPADAYKRAWDDQTREMYFTDLSGNEVWRCTES